MIRQWYEVHGRTFFGIAIPADRPYRGLGRRLSLRATKSRAAIKADIDAQTPWGWRYRRDWDRNSIVFMPVWLYWLATAWDNRYALHDRCVRLGFLDLREEGGYYREARWTWRWWRGQDRACAHMFEKGYVDRDTWHNRNWFQRFGWRIERSIDRFNATMPRWS